ncbi:beta strand repeat-containing protein [Anatilimnocola sp. NA78]|uniref:beta strand repeat-containing protein n=1 Tax=Anatilimnocola sp. NA78 TaxID=3415683 RepID=UPI003CE4C8A1
MNPLTKSRRPRVGSSRNNRGRRVFFEALEDRRLLTVVGNVNASLQPSGGYSWGANEDGWLYTPSSTFVANAITTYFSYGSQAVTLEIYNELPSAGGSLLRSGSFTTNTNGVGFYGDTFTSLTFTAGEDYFIGFRGIAGLGVNVTEAGGATSLPEHYSFGATPFYSIPGVGGFTSQPVLQFLNNSAPSGSINAISVNEGSSGTLSATVTDPDGNVVNYEWDLNYDGTFNATATGESVTFNASSLDGPGSRAVALRVTDNVGVSAIITGLVTITNVAPQNVSAGGPYTTNEGASLTLSGSATDPAGANDPLTYSWDVNGDNTFGDATGANLTLSWSALNALGIVDSGTRNVRVRVSDGDTTTTSAAILLTINNVAPQNASAGGPYTINEGASLTLSGSATDPAGANDPLTYSWDVNGDGTFGDAIGANPTLNWAALNALGIVDNGTRNVSVRVSDGDSGVTTSTSVLLTINNVAPSLMIELSSDSINENESTTLTGTITDPAATDTFTLNLNWGDSLSPNNVQPFTLGTTPLTVEEDGIDWNPTTRVFSMPHTYLDDNPTTTSSDEYIITVDVSDDDGAIAASPGTLYGISTSTDSLYNINASTGAATFIGGLGFDGSLVGAAFLNGVLYATDIFGDGVNTFGSVNLSTGAFTGINNQFGSFNWWGLAANEAADLLYTIDISAGNQLRTTTPEGLGSIVGPTATNITGLAYDDANGILYAATLSTLYSINTATGAATLIGSMGIAGHMGLDYDETSQVLFATAGGNLYEVNVSTGAATQIGPNHVSGIDGLAWLAGTANTITVTVNNVDPVAAPQGASTTEAATITPINVLTGAIDVGTLDVLSVVAASGTTAQGGVYTIAGDGAFTYDPNGAFEYLAVGEIVTDSVSFTIQDDDGGTSINVVTVTINGRNDAPVANPNTASTTENAPVTTDVIANDTDPDTTDVLSLAPGFSIASATFNTNNSPITISTATVTQSGNSIVFDPGADFDFLPAGQTAMVLINYTVQDDNAPALTSSGTLTITVNGENDAPIGNVDSYTAAEDTQLTIAAPGVLGNDTDVDFGTTLNVHSFTQPTHGGVALNANGSFTYTPFANYYGPDSFRYRVSDGTSQTSLITVTLDVTATEDYDFGDAPASYGVASHFEGAGFIGGPANSGPLMGTRDFEAASQPNGGATGDDMSGTDDEDGVTFSTTTLVPRFNSTITVNASAAGKLDAWIDFNRNNVFDLGEKIVSGLDVIAGNNTLIVAVPDGAVTGDTYARFRISTAGVALPTTAAADGEVEDYKLTIQNVLSGNAQVIDDPENPGAANPDLLLINGTSNSDAIVVQPAYGSSPPMVTVYNSPFGTTSSFPLDSFGRIVIHGREGNDSIVIQVNKPATVYGDSGIDSIVGGVGDDYLDGGEGGGSISGGAGNDVLIGGSGSDTLSGDGGRDVLIGGLGLDTLIGGADEDLEIGGSLVDSSGANIRSIMQLWKATQPFETRVTSLATKINASKVLDDGVADYVYGSGERDWLVDFALRDYFFDFNAFLGDRKN